MIYNFDKYIFSGHHMGSSILMGKANTRRTDDTAVRGLQIVVFKVHNPS